MKYCLEFGVRGGVHSENTILPTRAAAEDMARKLVEVFSNDAYTLGAGPRDWMFEKGCTRKTWKSSTHFVAVSKLDGKPRGPASAALWRKPSGPEVLQNAVASYYD